VPAQTDTSSLLMLAHVALTTARLVPPRPYAYHATPIMDISSTHLLRLAPHVLPTEIVKLALPPLNALLVTLDTH